ncbi:glycosyl transferase family 8 [Gluconobacter cerevisiae]|uniref:Glycosyl transferase family 8 n=1 Tax=Gluconobacter cerevisiae TaxID=1379734 RepID=A0ABR9YFY9_9PROT|nr:glycosyltransferase [Gluconobacter cerevisiae]MBF0877584.1 glycosyl transferase family 8 [Gluconobacter cerevisiae]
MSVQTCVCYCTDRSYLFPTLVSALQARAHATPDIADIIIVCFDVDAATISIATSICDKNNIILFSRSGSDIDGAPAMLGRLYLDEILPENYKNILYVDGDTQVKSSLNEFLSCPPPEGRFFASADPMVFLLDDNSKAGEFVRNHFLGIGLNPEQSRQYFNTGVLYFNRSAWAVIAEQARTIIRSQNTMSRFPDQDILNIVGIERALPMSLSWNFPVFLFNARLENTIQPKIVHYMSQPKPWEGIFRPWKTGDYEPYPAFVAAYPEIAGLWKRGSLLRTVRYFAQQHYKCFCETRRWGHGALHAQILSYEAKCRDAGKTEQLPV